MKLSIPYIYTEKIVPKRCRKPRSVQFPESISLTFREVTKEQAPVAFISSFTEYDENLTRAKKEYRFYKNKLYVKYKESRVSGGDYFSQTASEFSNDPYPYSLDQRFSSSYGWYGYPSNLSKQENRLKILDWAKTVLFIDGERWELSSEPRYLVMTFGLGCNHGGTSLSTSEYYNQNIPNKNYFRIDQFDSAVKYATKVALGRGDDRSVPFDNEYVTRFEILIPEAVRLKPNKEHGDGDAFMNKCENIISKSKDPLVSTFGLFTLLPEVMQAR